MECSICKNEMILKGKTTEKKLGVWWCSDCDEGDWENMPAEEELSA